VNKISATASEVYDLQKFEADLMLHEVKV